MIRSDEFKKFNEIGWKIKGMGLVFGQIKYEISRIWSGIPFVSRKRLGNERVSQTFNEIDNIVRELNSNLNTLPYLYYRIYRNVLSILQNVGAFFNNTNLVNNFEETISLENQTISDSVHEILKNIMAARNVNGNVNKGIDNPNIIDLFNINKARVNLAKEIVKQCNDYLEEILDDSNNVNSSKAADEIITTIQETIKNIKELFIKLNEKFDVVNGYFDELTKDVVDTLKSVFIDVDTNSSREDEINIIIAYSDLSEIYRMLSGSLKYQNIFDKLFSNKKLLSSNNQEPTQKLSENKDAKLEKIAVGK